MDRLEAAKVFVTIVERGSMIGAAEVLDMSRSMVTRYLSEMEEWSGARLLHRSTRRLSLTSAGEQVLDYCQRLLELAQEVPAVSHAQSAQPRGLLRISCSQFMAHLILPTVVRPYLAQYPQASVNFHVSSQTVDLVAERIDMAIRITNELDPSLIARRLGECESVVCAAPRYLASHSPIIQPEDLTRHNCLTYSYFGDVMWRFTQINHLVTHPDGKSAGQQFNIPVKGNLSANDSMVVLNATLAGEGIAMQPVWAVKSYLNSGELVPLLRDFKPQSLGVYGVYQSRKHMQPTLRVMMDMLVAYFASSR
ncbi:LysR family transcriptional regulator [Shewanella oneidensis MR-1]|uniref:Transcriptional regulator LysR family n=1 Tax=Shewanella oneidensis (strain ATCC 700550 / JCM 31522 / CIP 106686 / LMG 19005 / NCIMB 14063 / MR-1) TaxID=211586 RepID=Q8EBN6_SHEON|nr:LysR family transcriptional regulator [Shewanella oneidensis]AAN56466.1 transcriptional regulator LysR family [Shewanella oneidensis MR-1]MDX5999125.1 LysR family transcriptional regulator [Shewanella oneidensis]MEE2029095.1 HTH-type transcriptional regulator DmlR [Shewanella oneidensis]QKG97857.1 LysR family transcriptional regulator [Shewanella oneidensis MR-1]